MKKLVVMLFALLTLSACGAATQGNGNPDGFRTFDMNTKHGRVTCVENVHTGSLSCV